MKCSKCEKDIDYNEKWCVEEWYDEYDETVVYYCEQHCPDYLKYISENCREEVENVGHR